MDGLIRGSVPRSCLRAFFFFFFSTEGTRSIRTVYNYQIKETKEISLKDAAKVVLPFHPFQGLFELHVCVCLMNNIDGVVQFRMKNLEIKGNFRLLCSGDSILVPV